MLHLKQKVQFFAGMGHHIYRCGFVPKDRGIRMMEFGFLKILHVEEKMISLKIQNGNNILMKLYIITAYRCYAGLMLLLLRHSSIDHKSMQVDMTISQSQSPVS